MEYLIGIDLGTTEAKCVIYDKNGDSISEAKEEMIIDYPAPGQAQQDANDFYNVACRLIKKTISKSGISKDQIAAMSIDSQMGGIMSIDKNFNPVTYYDTPLDSRSAAENEYMHSNFGDLIIEKNGSISTYGNKIIYWKNKNEWKDIHKFIQPSAFVAGKLTGLAADDAYIDETFICYSGLSDLKNAEWSYDLCKKLNVDMARLPRIIKSSEIIGEVTKKGSEDSGLPVGLPVAAGCGDQSAGFIGAGIIEKGQLVDVSGTACILGVCTDEYKYDLKYKTLACMKSAIGDQFHLVSVVLAGRTHKWFVDEFFADEKEKAEKNNINIYDYLDGLAAEISPGSDGLISIDYLQGRFFPPDPNVRGLFIGHTWAHKKIHFYRSILESIAYDHYGTKEIIKELVPEINLKSVTAIGSGNKSKFWVQLKSDILQVPYRNLFRSDLSTLGSAILAGYSIGLFKDLEKIIKNFAKTSTEVLPVPGADKKYLKSIKIYKSLFDCLKTVYKNISAE
jgi:xylulokinase